MSLKELTEVESKWFDEIIMGMLDESAQRIQKLEKQLARHPNGPIRIALHPRLVAERAVFEWLTKQ